MDSRVLAEAPCPEGSGTVNVPTAKPTDGASGAAGMRDADVAAAADAAVAAALAGGARVYAALPFPPPTGRPLLGRTPARVADGNAADGSGRRWLGLGGTAIDG